MMRRVARVVAGCALVLALADSSQAAPTDPIVHAGRWLVDRSGRVVVVHGVNMPSKAPPAYPAALNFGDDDAQLIASLGFNAVRLTVERYAAEPKPGQFDDAYVGHIADTVRMLAGHGLMALIDFHQDSWGPEFFDNGFPDWMTQTDGLPNLYQVGFPAQYLANPALNRAFDHLWANSPGVDGHGLQDEDAAILGRVASLLRDEPGLLGYEIINEPWPGTAYPRCFTPELGCPGFDRRTYSAYYARTVPAIRRADREHMIFYEPLVSFNYGIPTHVQPPRDPRLGFAFHDYSACSASGDAGLPVSFGSDCGLEDEWVMNNAEQHAAKTGSALLQTEFGATTDTAELDQQLGLYDAHAMPWMFWSYTRYIDALNADGSLKPAVPGHVDQTMVKTLARPYPQLVAGTPEAWSFDPATKAFALRYTTRRPAGRGRFRAGAQTEIAAPPVQYPTGYGVAVHGATVVSAPGAATLVVAQCPGADEVSIAVSPAPGVSGGC
jgi:endoglycosylceramidase